MTHTHVQLPPWSRDHILTRAVTPTFPPTSMPQVKQRRLWVNVTEVIHIHEDDVYKTEVVGTEGRISSGCGGGLQTSEDRKEDSSRRRR